MIKQCLKDLSKDTIYYGLAHSLGRFISIFTAPIMTRVFSPSDYGVMDLITTTVSFMTLILAVNINGGIFREYFDVADREKGVLLFSGISPIMILVLVVDLVAVLLAGQISNILFRTGIYSNVIRLALLQIPIMILVEHFLILLRFLKRAKVFFVISVLDIILFVFFLLFYVVYLKFGIAGVYMATLSTKSILLLPLFYKLARYYSVKIDIRHIKNVMSFSLPLLPAVFVNLYLAKASTYFLNFYSSLENVGLYSIASKISSSGLIVAAAFGMGWMPFAYGIIKEKDKHYLYDMVLRAVFGIYGVIIFASSIFANEALIIITTEKYYACYNLVGFIALAQIMYYINTMVSLGINISKRTYFFTLAQLVGAIVATILFLLLIPRFGSLGAAVSFLVGFSSSSVFIYAFSQKLYPIPYNGIKILLIYGVTLSAIICVYHFSNLALKLSLQVMVLKALLVISFGLLMFNIALVGEERLKVTAFIKERIVKGMMRAFNTP